jgi:Bacterial Ig-like domain (group 3)
VCQDPNGNSTGFFETTLTVVGSTAATMTWSVAPSPALAQTATTTGLAASASSVEAGTSVGFTATVAPAVNSGTVTFAEGGTTLGTGTVTGGVATFSTTALSVGAHSVTATYGSVADYAPSTSSAVAVTVTTVAARATTTTLAVSPVSGAQYSTVTLTPAVTSLIGLPNGTVTIKDGATVLSSVPCIAGAVAPVTTNGLGAGVHNLVAVFVGTAPYTDSSSTVVVATYDAVGSTDAQTVDVVIPVGAILITTPYHAATTDAAGNVIPATTLHLGPAALDPASSTYSASAPFNDIVITDTRAASTGFTASVLSGPFSNGSSTFSGDHAGLTGLGATQVADNALIATHIVLTDHKPFVNGGLLAPQVFASYATGAGFGLGTAHIAGTFGIDKVPSSVTPGTYTATVTFTAV